MKRITLLQILLAFSIESALAQSWANIGTVGTLNNNELCYTDGTDIICDAGLTVNGSEALEVSGTVSATAFVGDGSGLVNLPASTSLVAGDTSVSIVDAGAGEIHLDVDNARVATLSNGQASFDATLSFPYTADFTHSIKVEDGAANAAHLLIEGSASTGTSNGGDIKVSAGDTTNSTGAYLELDGYAWGGTTILAARPSGDTNAPSQALELIGGSSWNPAGGSVRVIGGNSVNNVGGDAYIYGGSGGTSDGNVILANVFGGGSRGNVGIGTVAPATALEVSGTVSATAFVGDGSGLVNLPGGLWTDASETVEYEDFILLKRGQTTEDAGLNITYSNRAVFHADKGALRVGSSTGGSSDMNDANIGANSFALGDRNVVSGSHSFTAGYNNRVASGRAAALGADNTVSGNWNQAFGKNNTTTADENYALGSNNNLTGNHFGAVLGHNNTKSGLYGYVFGERSISTGNSAMAIGVNDGIRVSGNNSIGIGFGSSTNTTNVANNNVMALMGGNVGVGTVAPATALDVSGTLMIADGGEVCDASTEGAIRYTSGGGVEYCDSSAWGSFTGSGLWTDAGDYIERSGVRVYDASTVWDLSAGEEGMFFHADKSALRVGSHTNISSDEAKIGQYSLGVGHEVEAIGNYSIATGDNAIASGNGSIAVGLNTTANASYAVAMGSGSTASGTYAVSMGQNNTSNVFGAVSIGRLNTASSLFAIAIGDGNKASGSASVGLGYYTNATANYALAANSYTRASGLSSVALGHYAIASGDTSFAFGTGVEAQGIGSVIFGLDSAVSGTTVADNNTMAIVGGQVAINQVSANVELDVSGSIEYTGTITDVSDRRLKQNIQPLDSGALAKIDKIEAVSFEMKDNPSVTELGVIAQDFEKVYPELVNTADDEMGTKSVNYVGLIAPMIKAMQELKAEVETLKAENAEQKILIDQLMNK